MDQALADTLHTLRDIKGIQGSFIVGAETGQLLGRDLPSILDDATLAQVGPRIDRMLNVVESQPPTEALAMCFGDQRLDVRRMGFGHLCVLAEANISQPALRMAIKLVCRKLEGYVASVPETKPSVVPVSDEAARTSGPRYQFRGLRTDKLESR